MSRYAKQREVIREEHELDEQSISQAVELEDKVAQEHEDTKSSARREYGFIPCEITECRTTGEDECFSEENYTEDRICFRAGFGKLSNSTASELDNLSISFPSTMDNSDEIVTVKYEFVGEDETWEMREFWSKRKFPKNAIIRILL
jgi:hypothetical protein